ncbi:MAG: glycosyltransferase [Thermomicrobiales bacterium]
MKIGLVVPGFSAHESDWCIPALLDLVRWLTREDDVRVLTLRYPYQPGAYVVYGARVTALGGAARQRLGSALLWRRAFATLSSMHRREPFDVLHAFWATEAGFIAALAGRRLGVPAVISLAGGELARLPDIGYGDQLRRAQRLKIGLALRTATMVTAGSRYLLDRARPWLRSRAADTVHRAPLGVDLNRFQPGSMPVQANPPALIHAASLVPVKDQATLLRAAKILRERGQRFTLEVAGGGPLEPELRRLTQALDLTNMVRFHGAVPHHDLPAFYQRGAVFVLSSRHEAQGLAPLEALACGVPVVGASVGVVPELAPAAVIAVPPADPDTLADTLTALLADPARRAALAAVGTALVAEEYSLDRCATRFRDLYRLAADVESRRLWAR